MAKKALKKAAAPKKKAAGKKAAKKKAAVKNNFGISSEDVHKIIDERLEQGKKEFEAMVDRFEKIVKTIPGPKANNNVMANQDLQDAHHDSIIAVLQDDAKREKKKMPVYNR